MKSEDPNLI